MFVTVNVRGRQGGRLEEMTAAKLLRLVTRLCASVGRNIELDEQPRLSAFDSAATGVGLVPQGETNEEKWVQQGGHEAEKE